MSSSVDEGSRRVPAVVIRLDFEASRPRVLRELDVERDWERMTDWLRAHPDLRQLVLDAVALERQEAA